MSISQRTIKIVLATVFSILVAQLLQVENSLAAGIIAILNVLDTKTESITNGLSLMASTIVAFVIATTMFYFLGFTVLAFGLYLAIYVPIAHRFHLEAGIAPCSVLVTHFMIAGSIDLFWQINGLLIMAIGVVFAILVNLWMPSYKDELNKCIQLIEKNTRELLHLFYTHMLGKNKQTEIETLGKETEILIKNAEQFSLMEYDNQLFDKSNYYIRYTQMRKQQIDLLQKMAQNLSQLKLEIEQSEDLGIMFKEIAEQLHEENPGIALLDSIAKLYKEYRQSSLPKSREEFESRAVLFQILNETERFLELKRDFHVEHGKVTSKRI